MPPPNDNSQLATQRQNIRSFMEQYKDQFAMALPRMFSPERFVRVALTCINKNPKLLQCTRDSMLACLLDCAALGIEPDGRRAHLIPYKDKCTLIIDYKGIAELVRRSGEVSDLHADIICENDTFDYMFGTGSFLKHKIDIRRPRGTVIGAYSYVKLKDGSESFDVMGAAEIDVIRDRSPGYQYTISQGRKDNPWISDKPEMQKKTVFRRHSKWLPLSPELKQKLEKDDDEPLTEQERFAASKPVSGIQFDAPPAVAAEPEAAAAAADAAASETPEPEKRGRGRPRKTTPQGDAAAPEKPEPPAPATPLQGLRNLILTSKIEEPALLAYLFGQMAIDQGERLETMPEEKIKMFITRWPEIVEGMQAEAAAQKASE